MTEWFALLQVTHNLQLSDGDNGLMLLRDQIVIQIGEEIDGLVMIRAGDSRQGVCPVKFLQEVWQRAQGVPLITTTCSCATEQEAKHLNKIYYSYRTDKNSNVVREAQQQPRKKNNSTTWYPQLVKKNNAHAVKDNTNRATFTQYYYNNIKNNNYSKDSIVYLPKQNNLNNINNIFALSNAQFKNNQPIFSNYKAPFSSTKRPLTMKLSTPKKHVSNFFNRTLFRSDSQKRPLLLHLGSSGSLDEMNPDYPIVPANGIRISSIFTISENVEKFTPKNTLYQKRNFYITSSSRPLFVRK